MLNENSDDQLKSLQDKLYARVEDKDLKDRSAEIKQLGIARRQIDNIPAVSTQEPIQIRRLVRERASRRRKIFYFLFVAGLLIILAVAAAGLTRWYRAQQNVTQDQMLLEIAAPSTFTAGSEITYAINFGNNSRVDWHNVEVLFEAPPGFALSSSSQELRQSGRVYSLVVGTLPAKASNNFSLTGRLLAGGDEAVVAKTELTLTPKNFPSGRFTKTTLVTTTVTIVPLEIAVEVPSEAVPGERVLANIQITNTGGQLLEDIFVALAPASGIQLATTDPQFSPNFSVLASEWILDELQPQASATFSAVLFIDGKPGDKRLLDIKTGVMDSGNRYTLRGSSALLLISSAELAIDQVYNSVSEAATVRTGEKISGLIQFSNTGTLGLRDVVITAKFEGQGLNEGTLDLPAGAFNPTSRTITWTRSTVPELALLQAGGAGELKYEFEILPTASFPIAGEKLDNNALIITATVDSSDVRVPTGQEAKKISSRYALSIASDLTLDVASFYDDGRLGIASSGPLPPQVGEQTTYTVRLRLGSSLNDVGEVRVSAVLPDGVTYTDKTYLTAGEITFNDRTNELVWFIPLVKALTGRAEPAVELNFQVAVTPAEHQRGDGIALLNRLTGVATDLFTNIELESIVLNYPTTETASPGQGKIE